jgi:NAD(P)-dependent dehydrogenase (short-subunit alcohol dehydrogenase family)
LSGDAPAALVTGSSRGIGRAIALELAAAGFDVVVNYRRSEAEARAVAAEAMRLGRRALAVQADVAIAADRARLLEKTQLAFGRLDLLVNNAAVAPSVRADLLEAGEESFDAIIAANLKGPFFLAQAAARWMLEIRRQHPERRLSIINISSLSEYTPSVNRGDYCIAKAGLGMVTRLFASRLAGHGIRVNEVRPGIVRTDMTAGVQAKYDELIEGGLTPIRRWGLPEDVARAVRALASADFEFSTALAVDVDGGFHLHRL